MPQRHPQAQQEKISLLFKFEVQDHGNSNDKNCNDGANKPLVQPHSP